MTKMHFVCLLVLLTLTSCAAFYKVPNEKSFFFQNESNIDNKIEISYLYDIQSLAGNKRYANKERKYNVRTVALRIKNISQDTITLTQQNLYIYAAGKGVTQMAIMPYTKMVKQTIPTYLLHSLWNFFTYRQTTFNGKSETRFNYYPVGTAVGILNMAVAAQANTDNRKYLQKKEIFNKPIPPGETITGIVILALRSYETLTFEYNE